MVFGLFKHQDIPHSKNEESTKYEYQMWNHYVLTAETLRGYINFYYVTSNAMLSVFGVAEYIHPIVLMILPNENISVYDGEIIHSPLLEWVFKQAVPGNREIGLNSTLGRY